MVYKNIRILGLDYEVVMTYDNIRGDDNLGTCDIKAARIHLNDNQPDENKELTLLHEICHAISDMLYLDLSEAQISGMSTGLFEVIKINHYKVDWFD